MANPVITVEVVYATPGQQTVRQLQVPVGATVKQAIDRAEILPQFPEIDLAQTKIGIYSEACSLERVLQEADRVEIYRPLRQDPKQARRLRAMKTQPAKCKIRGA